MNRYVFTGRVHPERMEEYKERHAAVWPEMLDALKKAGFHNYSIHLGKDGALVGYFEAVDARACFKAMSKTEVNERWQTEMAPFFMIPEGKKPDEAFVFLEQVFLLE